MQNAETLYYEGIPITNILVLVSKFKTQNPLEKYGSWKYDVIDK